MSPTTAKKSNIFARSAKEFFAFANTNSHKKLVFIEKKCLTLKYKKKGGIYEKKKFCK